MFARHPFRRVIRTNQAKLSRRTQTNAFPLHAHLTLVQNGQQQIAVGIREQINAIDVGHTAVRPSQHARLQHHLAPAQRRF